MLFGIFPELYPSLKAKPWICPGCMETAAEPICSICIKILELNSVAIPSTTSQVTSYFPLRIAFSTPYRIMTHWKNHAGSYLREILFKHHPELIQNMNSLKFDAVIPIPQSEERNLKRGHSSAFETARYFSAVLDLPILKALKLQTDLTQRQAHLNRFDRDHSPNPFVLDLDQKIPSRILIVDDFITTGNTIEHAAKTLRKFSTDLWIDAACLGWLPRALPDPEPRFSYLKSAESELK